MPYLTFREYVHPVFNDGNLSRNNVPKFDRIVKVGTHIPTPFTENLAYGRINLKNLMVSMRCQRVKER